MLHKLQKPVYSSVSPSLAGSLKPLAHGPNVITLNLFYRYYFGRCSSELAELVPLILMGGPLVILIGCIAFFVTTPRSNKDAYVSSFFCHTARLWKLLPLEPSFLIYDLNGFKGTVMQTEKALINDRLRVSKVSLKFHIPIIHNFAVLDL